MGGDSFTSESMLRRRSTLLRLRKAAVSARCAISARSRRRRHRTSLSCASWRRGTVGCTYATMRALPATGFIGKSSRWDTLVSLWHHLSSPKRPGEPAEKSMINRRFNPVSSLPATLFIPREGAGRKPAIFCLDHSHKSVAPIPIPNDAGETSLSGLLTGRFGC